MDSPLTPTNTRFIAASIILFTACLFLFNIGKRDLWAPDEPRYTQVSKEMWDSGNFIVPHLNSDPYPHKPPLLFWLINLFSVPFGKVTALSARLPSALAGIGCCVMMFSFGRGLYSNTRIGLLTALILATSSKFLWMSHRVAFDVLLTFFVMMAIICFYYGYTGRQKKTWYFTLFYVFMAFGVLTKGPVGFLLPFLTVITYLIFRRDIKVLKETKPWIGGVLFAVLVFTWVYLASIHGGKEYAQQILFKQNVGRFASSFAHKRPFYYYFINFPINFFPWLFFIPSVVLYLCSKKGQGKIQNILLPIVWFTVIFVFFSIVSGKRDIYLFPLYPAASLIIAWFFNEFIEKFRDITFRKKGYLPCYILCGLALALGSIFPIIVHKFKDIHPEITFYSTIPFSLVLITGGFIMLRFLKYSRILPFLFTVIFVIFFTFNLSTIRAIPILNTFKSAKEFCNKANAIMKSGEKVAIYNFFRSSYLYYTNKNHIEIVEDLEALKKYMRSDDRVFLFIREKDFTEIPDDVKKLFFVLERDGIGHRSMLFVSNQDI